LENSCLHAAQNLCLLSRKVSIKIRKTRFVSVIFIYTYVELGLSPEKSAELRAFKSMELRRIFARKR
jgi:hypothetical protein